MKDGAIGCSLATYHMCRRSHRHQVASRECSMSNRIWSAKPVRMHSRWNVCKHRACSASMITYMSTFRTHSRWNVYFSYTCHLLIYLIVFHLVHEQTYAYLSACMSTTFDTYLPCMYPLWCAGRQCTVALLHVHNAALDAIVSTLCLS